MTKGSMLYPNIAYVERDENGEETGQYVCRKHWAKYYNKHCPHSQCETMKSLRNCRTGNQKINSTKEKGDRTQQLVCVLYGWEDLNDKYDNHKTPIDCYDPITGLFHQVRGRRYDYINKLWNTGNLEREWIKKYEDMVLICLSKDGKTVEEIYRIPHKEIKERKNISIVKNPTDRAGSSTIPWYRKYRVSDSEELKNANKIWQLIEESKKVMK